MIAATASGRHSSWLETAAPDQRERAEPLAADDDHGEPAAGGEAAPEKAGVDIDDEARLTSARSPGAARSQRPGPAVADGLAADRHGPVLLDALLPQAHGPAAGARAARARPRRRPARASVLLPGVDAVSLQAAMVRHSIHPAGTPGYAAHKDIGAVVLLAAIHAAGVRRWARWRWCRRTGEVGAGVQEGSCSLLIRCRRRQVLARV